MLSKIRLNLGKFSLLPNHFAKKYRSTYSKNIKNALDVP